jgi:glycosyltransferase involved in cell wall biosynthesis
VNLCASLVVRNELGRYLAPCIDHLLAFCDTVAVFDDASDDGTRTWLVDHDEEGGRLKVCWHQEPTFFRHEGRLRQRLLTWTLAHKPDVVISIDADEFVSDGAALRARIGREPDVDFWSLEIEEVWNADADALWTRQDGGWRSHPISVMWRADPNVNYRIMDRRLSCRRVPTHVLTHAAQAVPVAAELLHFGWTDESERAARYARYVQHDGGRFHARRHLDSILWDDARVTLRERPWPAGEVFDRLLERFTAVTA